MREDEKACDILKKVLITGATGLVGSSIYIALAEQPEKYDVYALDRNRECSTRVPAKNKGLEIPDDKFHLCDLTDAQAVLQAVSGMDVVVHLAADAGSVSWSSLLNNNIVGTYNVFEACRQTGTDRIIAASSVMVSQGHREQEPYKSIAEKRFADVPENYLLMTPEVPAEPRDIYSATKVWTESLARVFAHRHNLSCICIRIGQVEQDRPRPPYSHDVFVSRRDIVQIIECCINADEALRFEIFYGISNNNWCWVDIGNAGKKVGYEPRDKAEDDYVY